MTTVTSGSGLDLDALGIKSAQAASASTKKANLDQSDFLKLLTTQLKNQDPLKPVENEAFVAQMAQFSSLSGITEMNSKLGSILETLGQGQLSTATGLVGKYVLTSGTTAVPDASGAIYGNVALPDGATNATITFKDATGKVLHSEALGSSTSGAADFGWDGKNAAGETVVTGPVTIEATANVGSTREALATSVYALVQAVNLPTANSPMTAEVAGLGTIAFDKIQKVSS